MGSKASCRLAHMLTEGGRHYVQAALADPIWRAICAAAAPQPAVSAIAPAETLAAGIEAADPTHHVLIKRHALPR
jgi:hypothetical protein